MRDIWNLVRGGPEIDPDDLAHAIELEASKGDLDFRTRLLIQESVQALRSFRGGDRVDRWLDRSLSAEKIRSIQESVDRPGFPSLEKRLAVKARASDIEQFLIEVGVSLSREVTLHVGGSVALILGGHLERHTEDIDMVDEVPGEIRHLHDLLEKLQIEYGLSIAHFQQSHYLPDGWKDREHSAGSFGRIRAFLVDPGDIFLSKLFSARTKDRSDLRTLAGNLDRGDVARRLHSTCDRLLKQPRLRENARENWYILFGEELPA